MAKRRLRQFSTGLLTTGDEPLSQRPVYKAAGWSAVIKTRKERGWEIHPRSEVMLLAGSWATAQRGLDLIYGCHQLVSEPIPLFPFYPIAHNTKEPTWMDRDERAGIAKTKTYLTHGFPLACAMAAKASRRLKWVYAVTKCRFSMSLHYTHHVDTDPWRSPHLPISSFPADHVMFAYAIVSAYSAIEDLGLEVRATNKNPSKLSDGTWNPPIKQDLERRLTKAGVNLAEPFLWLARGPKRRIERKKSLPCGKLASWSRSGVGDSEIPVIDAIAYASFLRSRVASHTAKDLTRGLSPYDVCNVQDLARRLTLETLGFWRVV